MLGSVVDPLLGPTTPAFTAARTFFKAFWGWVWGGGGALICVPIAVAIAIVCREFFGTVWISDVLTANTGHRQDQTGKETSVTSSGTS